MKLFDYGYSLHVWFEENDDIYYGPLSKGAFVSTYNSAIEVSSFFDIYHNGDLILWLKLDKYSKRVTLKNFGKLSFEGTISHEVEVSTPQELFDFVISHL